MPARRPAARAPRGSWTLRPGFQRDLIDQAVERRRRFNPGPIVVTDAEVEQRHRRLEGRWLDPEAVFQMQENYLAQRLEYRPSRIISVR